MLSVVVVMLPPVAIWMAADSELIISLYDESVIIFCAAVTHFISVLEIRSETEKTRHLLSTFLFSFYYTSDDDRGINCDA